MTQQGNATNPGFDNPTREEKLRILEELRQDRPGTRAAYTRITDPEPSGRWSKPDRVTGREPFVDVPRLPASSPWAQQQPPDEMPTGYSVEEMPVMGEPWEAERAAQLLSAATDSLQGGSCGEAGISSPATTASLSSTAGLAEGPSPVPEGISPLPPDAAATDPTSSSSLGSGDPSSHSLDQRQLAQSPPPDAPKVVAGVRWEGAGSPLSRPSFRRIG